MTIKLHRVGGMAFPKDFNWECPFCGRENQAFQFPTEEVDGGLRYKLQITKKELQQACQYCQPVICFK